MLIHVCIFVCSVGIVNHLSQVSKPSADDTLQTSVMSSSAGSKSQQASIQVMDVSPSRPAVYPNSVYTTPTKSDSQSLVQSANKVESKVLLCPISHLTHPSLNFVFMVIMAIGEIVGIIICLV